MWLNIIWAIVVFGVGGVLIYVAIKIRKDTKRVPTLEEFRKDGIHPTIRKKP